jgi:hypothetical protein
MGTFLFPYDKLDLNSLTILGHLFGGGAGQDFRLVSNSYIQQPSILTPNPNSVVPLPAALPLFATGLACLDGVGSGSKPPDQTPDRISERPKGDIIELRDCATGEKLVMLADDRVG